MTQQVEEFLEHHGVKGMHWHQRKQLPQMPVNPGVMAANIEDHNPQKPIAKTVVKKKEPTPVKKDQNKESSSSEKSTGKGRGGKKKGKSGKKRSGKKSRVSEAKTLLDNLHFSPHSTNPAVRFSPGTSAANNLAIAMKNFADAKAKKKVTHSMTNDVVEDFLEHHGVKGMKWGVRKERPSSVTVSVVGKQLKTTGGYNNKTTKDAANAAISRRKAQISGTRSLSDKQLKQLVNRMNLEKQYSQLNPSTVQKGHDFVKAGLALTATASSIYAFYQSPLGKKIASNINKVASNRRSVIYKNPGKAAEFIRRMGLK